jgi:hypothetical protein
VCSWPSNVFNGDRAEFTGEGFHEYAGKRAVAASALRDDAIFYELTVERKLGAVALGEDGKSITRIKILDFCEASQYVKHGLLGSVCESKMLV